MVQDKNQAEAKHIHDMGGKRQQEEEEMAIIPPTNAVVHPRTVMVEILRENRIKRRQEDNDEKQTLQNIKIRRIDDFCLPHSHVLN